MEVGQYGDTHYFTLNEWKPENATNTSSAWNSAEEWISVEDIPF
jgi:hypothetical protein